jgi:hypothetical protein
MEREMNVNLEVSQHLEEKLADEAEERRLECDSEDEISEVGDLYHMNISVDLANRDLTEADVTEVDQEFIDALVEIEGQKEFPCTKCGKICKSKGGLTRHSNSKHRGESVDSGSRVNTGLCQATTASIVETIKNNITQENIYGDEINTSLKTLSAGEALFEAILPLYETFITKKNQDKLLEDFYGLIPRSCELLNCGDFKVANLIMIHIPDHLVGFYNISQMRDKGESSSGAEQPVKINPAELGPLSYVGGYVVSQLFKRNKGKSSPQNEELQALLQNMKSAESNSFISARTRGGLVTPCNDLVGILEEAEVLFRSEISKSKLVLRNIPTDKVCLSTLESPTVKSLWDNIVLASGINSGSSTTKLCLENVVKLYLKVRSFSYVKDYVVKYKMREKEVKKRALRKT